MPDRREKTEADFREHEILDAARAQVGLVIATYRRRMANVEADLIADFREQCAAGTMPAIDAAYRERIRALVEGRQRAVGDGR